MIDPITYTDDDGDTVQFDAPDHAGVIHIVTGENGCYINLADIPELAQQLTKLAEDATHTHT